MTDAPLGRRSRPSDRARRGEEDLIAKVLAASDQPDRARVRGETTVTAEGRILVRPPAR